MSSFRSRTLTALFILLIALSLANAYAIVEMQGKYGDVSTTNPAIVLNGISIGLMFILTIAIFYIAFTRPYGQYVYEDQILETQREIEKILRS